MNGPFKYLNIPVVTSREVAMLGIYISLLPLGDPASGLCPSSGVVFGPIEHAGVKSARVECHMKPTSRKHSLNQYIHPTKPSFVYGMSPV